MKIKKLQRIDVINYQFDNQAGKWLEMKSLKIIDKQGGKWLEIKLADN